MNAVEARQLLDDVYWELINFTKRTSFFFQSFFLRKYSLQNNKKLKNKFIGKRCFIVGNGPSLKKQNLKLLRDEYTFFVNRAFLHDDYAYIKPAFHTIIDPKLETGEWPISFLDEIHSKNPETQLILNAKWMNSPKFERYKNQYNIIWILNNLTFTRFSTNHKFNITNCAYGGAVVEQSIATAIYLGFTQIYLLGVDGNGLAYNMINENSHFYGNNPEDLLKSATEFSNSLYMSSRSMRSWFFLSQCCKKMGIELINLTNGGIMNMLQRADYENILSTCPSPHLPVAIKNV